jgi:hypothetical protein
LTRSAKFFCVSPAPQDPAADGASRTDKRRNPSRSIAPTLRSAKVTGPKKGGLRALKSREKRGGFGSEFSHLRSSDKTKC